MRARSKRQFITWISVVAVAALLIGITSWWLVVGRVTRGNGVLVDGEPYEHGGFDHFRGN